MRRHVWGALVKCKMRPLGIGEFDAVIDDHFFLEPISDFVQIDGYLLKGSPEPLNKDVVEIVPAIH